MDCIWMMKFETEICSQRVRTRGTQIVKGTRLRETYKQVSVLVERQSYQNKLSTPFISTPHKLIEKTGNKCVVESPEGVTYQRNSTHVKKYNDPISVGTDSGTVANDNITISNNDIQVHCT